VVNHRENSENVGFGQIPELQVKAITTLFASWRRFRVALECVCVSVHFCWMLLRVTAQKETQQKQINI
jgi:hypothetical protein